MTVISFELGLDFEHLETSSRACSVLSTWRTPFGAGNGQRCTEVGHDQIGAGTWLWSCLGKSSNLEILRKLLDHVQTTYMYDVWLVYFLTFVRFIMAFHTLYFDKVKMPTRLKMTSRMHKLNHLNCLWCARLICNKVFWMYVMNEPIFVLLSHLLFVCFWNYS